MEIKNKLTVTRGEVGGNNGGKGRRVLGNNYKGHIDKTKGRWDQGREMGMVGVVGSGGENMKTTVLEQQ